MAKQYADAGGILDKMLTGGGAMKTLLYGSGNHQAQIPMIHALVCETLKYKRVLDTVLSLSGILATEKWLSTRGHIVHVMLYDLLIGKGIQGAGKLKKTLASYQATLKSTLTRVKIKAQVASVAELVPVHLRQHHILPRYARINRLRVSKEVAVAQFKKDGYTLVTVDELFKTNTTRDSKIFAIDPDICDGHLLVFPPFTDLHAHPYVVSGSVILQDKASAFSGWALDAPPGCTALDSCAAPGMKTSQICDSMQNQGKLFAFEKSPKRWEILVRLGERNGLKNMVAKCEDFLETKPDSEEYREVGYILCDPSCSGSGIVSRMDDLIKYALEATPSVAESDNNKNKKKGKGRGGGKSPRAQKTNEKNDGGKQKQVGAGKEDEELSVGEHDDFLGEESEADRLKKLSEFQESVVTHALSFPNIKKVIYSTCSVNQEENENVVMNILKNTKGKFKVFPVLPNWKRRGTWDPTKYKKDLDLTEDQISEIVSCCVRTKPEEDHTIGFFVACFVPIDTELPQKNPTQQPREVKKEKEIDSKFATTTMTTTSATTPPPTSATHTNTTPIKPEPQGAKQQNKKRKRKGSKQPQSQTKKPKL